MHYFFGIDVTLITSGSDLRTVVDHSKDEIILSSENVDYVKDITWDYISSFKDSKFIIGLKADPYCKIIYRRKLKFSQSNNVDFTSAMKISILLIIANSLKNILILIFQF